MKIAYVLSQYPSLTETFIAREIAALRRYGFEIDVWALKAGAGAQAISIPYTVKLLGRLQGQNRRYWQSVGQEWARRERTALAGVEWIHAAWASFPADIALGAARELDIPWSFFGHARDLWVEGSGLEEKLRLAQFAASCTRPGVEILQRTVPEIACKVLYAPHGLNLEEYPFHGKRSLQEPARILAVGRLIEKKGFAVLLEALRLLSQEGHRLQATIIGEGRLRSELEKQLPPGLDISLPGAMSADAVARAMQNADLLVMPSLEAADGDRDGLPNVLLEAAASGLPMVSTRAGAITDFLDEECAWLCDAGDASALAGAMQAALCHYGQSLHRAREARKRVESQFDIECNIAVLAQAFRTQL